MMVPKSFNDFTVKQFMAWHEALKEKYEDILDREYKLISIAYNIPLQEVYDTKREKIREYVAHMDTLRNSKMVEKVKRVIIVNKKVYVAILNPKEIEGQLTTNQFTAAKEYTKEDPNKHLNKLLSLLYCPYKFLQKPRLGENLDKVAEDFLNAKIGDVYGLVFFYSKLWKNSLPVIIPYLNQATKTVNEFLAEALGTDSEKTSDGISS